ncbi:Opacity protein opA54, partial [Neisseria gonorrhoeae]
MKRKPYSNCLLLLFQDFFQRFGINQTYSGLTKIRTRRRVADGTDGTEPVRPA